MNPLIISPTAEPRAVGEMMQGVPQGAQRGNHRTRWAVRPLPAPRLRSSPSRGSCGLSVAESSLPQRVGVCVGRGAGAGVPVAEPRPGFLGT